MLRIHPSVTHAHGSLLPLAALLCLCAGSAPPAVAQEAALSDDERGWWFEIRGGGAELERDSASSDRDSKSGWVIDFAGGIRVGQHWLVGIALGGVTVEAFDLYDSTEGASLSNLFAVAQYHSGLAGGWLLHAGAGWSSYTDNALDGYLHEGDGWGAELGAGYEWQVSPHSALVVLARYELGNISPDAGNAGSDYGYSALKLSASWSFR